MSNGGYIMEAVSLSNWGGPWDHLRKRNGCLLPGVSLKRCAHTTRVVTSRSLIERKVLSRAQVRLLISRGFVPGAAR